MTHLLMNMVSLYIIGRGMERYFSRQAYLLIYLFSGLLGAMASLFMHPESISIGASGAIFGVFGALAGFFLAYRKQIAVHSREFMKEFIVILGLNLLLGFSIESIDVSAHLAGLFAGFIGGFMLSQHPKRGLVYAALMGVVLFVGSLYFPVYYVPMDH
jgi:rhomboid protease GluP